jgi:hypothetical protein
VSEQPHWGVTRTGYKVHLSVWDHHPDGTPYQRFNKRLALWITSHVFTMTCFYLFNLLALASLPAVLVQAHIIPGSLLPAWLIRASFIALIAWIAQTYFQLVLLPSIGVGQNLQASASDARAAKEFEDTETVLGLQQEVRELLASNTELTRQVHELTTAIHTAVTRRGKHG